MGLRPSGFGLKASGLDLGSRVLSLRRLVIGFGAQGLLPVGFVAVFSPEITHSAANTEVATTLCFSSCSTPNQAMIALFGFMTKSYSVLGTVNRQSKLKALISKHDRDP